jgi:hypothetical protein
VAERETPDEVQAASAPPESRSSARPGSRRLHAVLRLPLLAILGALIAVFASYLLRKIGY